MFQRNLHGFCAWNVLHGDQSLDFFWQMPQQHQWIYPVSLVPLAKKKSIMQISQCLIQQQTKCNQLQGDTLDGLSVLSPDGPAPVILALGCCMKNIMPFSLLWNEKTIVAHQECRPNNTKRKLKRHTWTSLLLELIWGYLSAVQSNT